MGGCLRVVWQSRTFRTALCLNALCLLVLCAPSEGQSVGIVWLQGLGFVVLGIGPWVWLVFRFWSFISEEMSKAPKPPNRTIDDVILRGGWPYDEGGDSGGYDWRRWFGRRGKR